MFKGTVARWQKNFFTGLAVFLPIVLTLALAVWLFGTVTNITNTLLFFIPKNITHGPGGEILWNWQLLALLVAFLAVSLVGGLTRYYIGRKMVQIIDKILLSIPMLNRVYSTIKQVNDAFSSDKKTAFQQVVLVEFPRAGLHSIGFVTGHGNHELGQQTGQVVVSVFVPTTPNPTTGFLILAPQEKLTPLNISVADGIKFLISLGSAAPEQIPQPELPTPTPVIVPHSEEAAGVTEFVTGVVQRAGAATTDESPERPNETPAPETGRTRTPTP